MAERIIKGEKAILMELDLMKKKEERNKLLRFNDPNYKSDIELQNTTKKEELTKEDNETKDNKQKL